MPNGWIKQAFVQGFYFEAIAFKRAITMFDCNKVAESIY